MKDWNAYKEYYEKEYVPWLPENWQWRLIFMLKDRAGIKDRIHRVPNPQEQLRQIILKHQPDMVYYRTSCFLNPDRISEKSNSDRFIMSDLFFDIDTADFEESKVEAKKLLNWLEENGYPEGMLVFSGRKGWHIVIPSFFKEQTEKEVQKKLKSIYKQVLDAGIQIDAKVCDTRRVLGLPGTIHSESGCLREIIDPKLIDSFTPTHIAPGTLPKKRMIAIPSKQRTTARTGVSPCPISQFVIGSSVLGTKGRHIFVCKLPESFTYPQVWKALTKKAEKYNLPHLYILKFGENYFGVCLEPMPLEQLKKDKDCLYWKFKQAFLPLFRDVGEGREQLTFVDFVEYAPCKASKAHIKAFKSFGIPLPNYTHEIGSTMTKLSHGTGKRFI